MAKIGWDAGLDRAAALYPSTRERDWSEPLRDVQLLGDLVRDVLALSGAQRRRGQRTHPTPRPTAPPSTA